MTSMRVLFLCNKNAVRSPMAEAIGRVLAANNKTFEFQSAGVDPSDIDGFAIAAMSEQNIDLMRHEAQDLADFSKQDFDCLICLSTGAIRHAEQRFGMADFIEHWDVGDPSLVDGNREQQLEAYRQVRDTLTERIRKRFSL